MTAQTKSYLGDDGVVSLWIPGGVFNHASRLVDLDQLYMIFLSDPDYYQALMEFCLKRTRPWLEAQLAADLDIVNIGGNVAGGFLGKPSFDQFVLPYEKRYIEFVKSKGKYTQYHNCGEIMGLLDSYKTMGSDIIEPFSPPPLGDADMAEVVQRADNAFVVVGNIDQVNVIQKGTPGLVREKVKEVCGVGKQYPRFILQTADFLEYDTPVEHVRAYAEAGKEYGRF
jgi:uroporphyrinogen decarboxylase